MEIPEELLYYLKPYQREIVEGAFKRLKRGVGSGAPSGFTDAKREVEPDGAEGLPQSSAVSPVKAQSAMLEIWVDNIIAADEFRRVASEAHSKGEYLFSACKTGAAQRAEYTAAMVERLLTEPESEQPCNTADIKQSQGSPEADATPSNRSASGRRNDKIHP